MTELIPGKLYKCAGKTGEPTVMLYLGIGTWSEGHESVYEFLWGENISRWLTKSYTPGCFIRAHRNK